MRFSKISTSFLCLLAFSVTPHAEPWKFEIAPYLWAMGMNGRVQVASRAAHVDESFSDIVRQLNFGGMLWVDAKKDKFGIYGNAVYAVLSDSGSRSALSADFFNRYGIFGAGISYEVFRYCFNYGCPTQQGIIFIEPYAGFRYTLNDTALTVQFHSFRVHGVKNVHWTDPLIGLRFNYWLNKNWFTLLSADMGGTNGSTHYSYSWMALLSYTPDSLPNSKFYLGYRLLDQRYQTGSGRSFYDWNMKLAGPVLGFGYSF